MEPMTEQKQVHGQPKADTEVPPGGKPDAGVRRDLRDPTRPEGRGKASRVPDKATPRQGQDPEDGHIGATEDQVSDTPAPAGSVFEDEPRQG
jgi:hypothetical protein